MNVLITSGRLPPMRATEIRLAADGSKWSLIDQDGSREIAWIDSHDIPHSILPKHYHTYLYAQTLDNWLGAV